MSHYIYELNHATGLVFIGLGIKLATQQASQN